LDLQQHGVEWCEVAKPNYKIEEILIVLALGVEPRVRQELIEQRSGFFCVKLEFQLPPISYRVVAHT
jgi:hypothetical protein